VVFWVVALCSLLDVQYTNVSEEHAASTFRDDDGENM
jgi:hypothetical protein